MGPRNKHPRCHWKRFTSPIMLRGLDLRSTYSFHITATNSVGSGAAAVLPNVDLAAIASPHHWFQHGNGLGTRSFQGHPLFGSRTESAPLNRKGHRKQTGGSLARRQRPITPVSNSSLRPRYRAISPLSNDMMIGSMSVPGLARRPDTTSQPEPGKEYKKKRNRDELPS